MARACTAVSVLLMLAGCGARTETGGTVTRASAAPSQPPMERAEPEVAVPAELSSMDRDFLQQAVLDGLKEVQMGRAAERQASIPDVREFAKHLIADHTAANQELMRLAERKGVTVPGEAGPKDRRAIERLARLQGADFDRAWVRDVIADHEENLREFQREARDTQDRDVRAWAEKMIPALEQHLEMARKVRDRLGEAGGSAEPPRAR